MDKWREVLLAQVRGAIAGGVDVVQIRERGIDARQYVIFIRECVRLAHARGCRVIVNDRLDLALAGHAGGVHLREGSIPLDDARRLSHGDFLLGRSVHAPTTAERARKADYLIAGSVFDTASKPGAATLGLGGLREVVRAAGECPVWAVGGLTPENVTDIKASGARGVAAIGAFFPSAEPADIAREVRRQTEAFRRSLDQGR